jgi:hypothetical protein
MVAAVVLQGPVAMEQMAEMVTKQPQETMAAAAEEVPAGVVLLQVAQVPQQVAMVAMALQAQAPAPAVTEQQAEQDRMVVAVEVEIKH